MKFTDGVQIVYIPQHAGHDVTHPDCEEGFVFGVSKEPGYVFCRYWAKGKNYLRTRSCSEYTPAHRLFIKETRPQELVDATIKMLRDEMLEIFVDE